MSRGFPVSQKGPDGISKHFSQQIMRVEKRSTDSVNTKLYQFKKDGRYTDVTLKFEDGQKTLCHRWVGPSVGNEASESPFELIGIYFCFFFFSCVLASSSNYFDCMFSNGMRESSEDVSDDLIRVN